LKRALWFVAGLFGALVLHLVLLRLFPEALRYVDLFLVVLVLNALGGSSLSGMFGGMAAGLVADTVAGTFYGLYGVVGTALGYTVARASQMLTVQSRRIVTLIIVLAAAVQQLMVAGLLFMVTGEAEVPDPFWMMVKSLVCGAFGITLIWLGRILRRRFIRARSSRVSKVRFS
jgi:rod shape-determining protein MreD